MDKPNILIIEDDFSFANDLKNCLTGGGYHVGAIINNVDEAIAYIDIHQPDGIVLDLQLKDKLGFDILNYVIPSTDEDSGKVQPDLLVVSSFLAKRVLRILNQKKCFSFDKNHNYNHLLVLNYFDSFLISNKKQTIIHTDEIIKNSSLLTDEQIKDEIYKVLRSMNFDTTATAFEYLLATIFFTYKHPTNRNLSVAFKTSVTHIEYGSAFTGVKRLIDLSFSNDPALFCESYVSESSIDCLQKAPTPKEFIFQIANIIRIKYTF